MSLVINEEIVPKLSLDNDDFRKLLMARSKIEVSKSQSFSELTIEKLHDNDNKSAGVNKSEERQKKKAHFAKLKKLEEDTLTELSKKYRDRAKERRERTDDDYERDDNLTKSSGYRAVAPDAKSNMNAYEIRHKLIQESKYLGGDMEHTHLVKGLDYALLHKVRDEIQLKQQQVDEENSVVSKNTVKIDKDTEFFCKSHFTQKICSIALVDKKVVMNPLFSPGRMAYVVDLTDDTTDIPIMLVRSKSEVPNNGTTPTLTINDIVITKLAEILSYLRDGNRQPKKSKKKNVKVENKASHDKTENLHDKFTEDYIKDGKENLNYRTNELNRNGKVESKMCVSVDSINTKHRSSAYDLLSCLAGTPTGYAECYPGQHEMHDAIEDSDDEVDYTKMDLGYLKGAVSRWDFDSQEDYNEYLSNKEALPRAAFQYGLKMSDGRRTRKYCRKSDKAVLDQEWKKIQGMIQKRKEVENKNDFYFCPSKLQKK